MPMKGGTRPKETQDLTNPWSRHLRRVPEVQQALAIAHDSYPGPPAAKRRPKKKAIKKTPMVRRVAKLEAPAYLDSPIALRPWLKHVWRHQQAHPNLTRSEVLSAAALTYNGVMGPVLASM